MVVNMTVVLVVMVVVMMMMMVVTMRARGDSVSVREAIEIRFQTGKSVFGRLLSCKMHQRTH
jgi:hypothetical protein